MDKDEYTFPEMESSSKKKRSSLPDTSIPMEKLLGDSRRIDDALLQALSLVLSSNSEYARSVSALLETDLNREQVLNQLHSKTQELLDETKKLVKSQDDLSNILTDFTEDYKTFFEETLNDTNEKHQDYMDAKFSALFTIAGLKPDGTDHAPADKLIINIKSILTQRIWFFIGGAIIYHMAMLFSKKWGGF